MSIKVIQHIIRKEFIQIRRDKKMLFITFFAPIFQLIILGYAANLDVRNIPMIVYDLDNSISSRDIMTRFTSSGYFIITQYANTMDDIDRSIMRGDASVALIIPKNFSTDLLRGYVPRLKFIVDGAETNSAIRGLNYAMLIVTNYSRSIVMETFKRGGVDAITKTAIEPEVRIWYNPDLKSRNFMVPGVLGLLLMIMTLMLTSLATVREREVGTLEQLIVTPVKSYELIIGKILPFTVIGLIDVILVILVAVFWFSIPIKGSIILLVFLCLIFLLTTLGLGLFVSTISRTQQQAMVTAIFFVMLPMIYLSGFVFPIENMPTIIQNVTYLMPLRYFFVIIRGIFLKGIGVPELWSEGLIMLLLGALIFSLSVIRFQKKLG